MWGLLAMKQVYLVCNIALLLPMMLFSQSAQEKEETMLDFFYQGYDYIYVQRDSAYHYLENALSITDEIDDYDSGLGILDYIIRTADYHHDLPKFRNTLKHVDSILSERNITQKIQGLEEWNLWYLIWLASYHFETTEYVKAKELFLEARSHFDEILTEQLSTVQAERLYTIYSSLGTTYMNLGNYELAELNYRRSIQLVSTSTTLKENAEAYITGSNQSIAQLYTRIGKHEAANSLYTKNLNWSKQSYKKDKMFKNNLVNAFHKITASYIKQDSLDKALRTLNESQSYLLENDSSHKDAFVLYGDIFTNLDNYNKALAYYQNALEFLNTEKKGQINQESSEVYGKIATLYLKQKNYQEGLKTIRKAFNVSGKNITIVNHQEYPDPKAVFSKTLLLELLDTKLQLLELAYQQTSKPEFKNYLLKTCNAILNTFDFLKMEFDSKIDKTFLAERAYPIFYRMLDAVYKISLEEPSSQNIQLALNIAEKNKDFLLLEALRNSQASEYGEVPEELLDKEAQLRSEITYLEKEAFDASDKNDSFSEKLYEVKQEYYSFLEGLKSGYPKYHNLKYQTEPIELETIRQKLLDDNGVLVSYTVTDGHLFAVTVGATKEKFLKIPFSQSDRQMIHDFYRQLSKPTMNYPQADISNLGRWLYESVIKKPLEGFDRENLIIIPDGELHYLPFEMLEKNGIYLLHTMNFSYGNSVASLLETHGKVSEEMNLLAFAPSFKETDTSTTERQFGQLRYNSDEVNKINGFYNATTYLKHEATLKNFVVNSPEFNIVHLATHASANDEYPDYSYLAFTDKTEKETDNVLYIKDLYNLKLPADMVVLSACQTGIGKLQKGQGMMSLSKGFYYAGAKSLVNTLWKINDKSTVKLMEYFYEGLSQGRSKSEALREAKLKYLESTDDDLLKHPYYWAAFVVSGDIEPISNPVSNWWWMLIGLGIFLLIVTWNFSNKGKDFRKVQLRI